MYLHHVCVRDAFSFNPFLEVRMYDFSRYTEILNLYSVTYPQNFARGAGRRTCLTGTWQGFNATLTPSTLAHPLNPLCEFSSFMINRERAAILIVDMQSSSICSTMR